MSNKSNKPRSSKPGVFGTLRQKMLFGTLFLAIVPVLLTSLIVGGISLTSGKDALEEGAKNALIAQRDIKKGEIETYFKTLENSVHTLAVTPTVIDAMKELPPAMANVRMRGDNLADMREKLAQYYTGDFAREYEKRNSGKRADMSTLLKALTDEQVVLQYRYIFANPSPLGEKFKLDDAGDGSEFSRIHARVHPFMRSTLTRFGYYDTFLIDLEGTIVYTTFKELDFTTSLDNTGSTTGPSTPSARTGLGDVFRRARRATKPDFTALSDFAPYFLSYEDQASFLAVPIFDKTKIVGVLAVQVPIDQINAVMTYNKKWKDVGLGASGETYLVGPDFKARSLSRFMIEEKDNYLKAIGAAGVSADLLKLINVKDSNIGLQPVDTPGAREAITGQAGYKIFPDYRNIPVLSAYAPVNILGLRWAILSEIDEDEAFLSVAKLRNQIGVWAVGVALALLLVGFLIGFSLIRSVTRPLGQLQATVGRVSSGDYDARALITGSDELGQLGSALNDLLDERLARLAQIEKENEQLNNSIVDLLQAVAKLARRDLTIQVTVTEDVTGPMADALNLMTKETAKVLRDVTNISLQVATASDKVKTKSDAVIAVANEERTKVEQTSVDLAKAAAEMNHIAELAETCRIAADNAINTTQKALETVTSTVSGINSTRDIIRETEKRIKRLGERSQEISGVVSIINSIAERTSILALNASMHAASAGEAGRGFAVVAEEVQRLAENARTATAQITTLVSNIQVETAETVNTMNSAITQVVEGSKLAERAGEEMQQTRQTTAVLVASVQEIAATSARQAEATQVLQERAHEIRESTQLTSQELAEQTVQTNSLVEYAKDLLAAVRVFKLPSN